MTTETTPSARQAPRHRRRTSTHRRTAAALLAAVAVCGGAVATADSASAATSTSYAFAETPSGHCYVDLFFERTGGGRNYARAAVGATSSAGSTHRCTGWLMRKHDGTLRTVSGSHTVSAGDSASTGWYWDGIGYSASAYVEEQTYEHGWNGWGWYETRSYNTASM